MPVRQVPVNEEVEEDEVKEVEKEVEEEKVVGVVTFPSPPRTGAPSPPAAGFAPAAPAGGLGRPALGLTCSGVPSGPGPAAGHGPLDTGCLANTLRCRAAAAWWGQATKIRPSGWGNAVVPVVPACSTALHKYRLVRLLRARPGFLLQS